jgi:tetratricopeptide (TPR) repeat protein
MRFLARHAVALSTIILCAVSFPRAQDTFSNLIQSGKYQDAIQYAEKQLPPASRTIDIWIGLAQAYEKVNMKDQVLACYKEAQKINPSEPRVHYGLGNYYFETRNFAEALKYFQSGFLLKRTALAAERMALSAANLNQWDKAKDAAESAVSLDSTVFECRPILVKLYLQEKNWTGAVEQLEFITKRSSATLDQWKLIAECYEKAGMKEKLPHADSMIVLLDRNNVPSRIRFADYSLAEKDTVTALRLYKELAILTPTDPKPFRNLYQLSTARGNIEDATLYLKNFLVLDSGDAGLYWVLGDLLSDQKDITGALESYRKAFRKKPQNGKGHFKKYAEIVLQKKLDKEAIEVITAAANNGETDVFMYTALGDIYQKLDQCPNAAKMYQEVLKTDPKNLRVLNELAECQAKSGDVKNAIISYEQIVLMNPRPSLEYKALGDLQTKNGRRDNAIAAYKKYLETTPGDQPVAKAVGLYSYEMKQYPEAVKYLSLVQDGNLRDVALLTALGLSASQTNDCNAAIDALAKVWSAKAPAAILMQILTPLAECYERNNNIAKAAEAYEAYASLPGVNNTDVAYRGAFLKEKSDRTGAIKAYTTNTVSYPKDYRNFLRLGLLYAADSAALDRAAANLTAASLIIDTVRVLWRTLAIVQERLKNETKELAAWQKLVMIDPQDLEGNRRIGTILANQKQFAQAIAPLEVAAMGGAQDYDLLRLLANCYLETKRPKEAMVLLRKAKLLQPDDPSIRVAIIAAGTAIGPNEPVDKEKDELAEIDKKVTAKDRKNIESRIRLVQYYEKKEDFNNAFTLLKELSVLTPKEKTVFRKLYEISARNGNKQEAADHLKKYLAIDPTNAKAFRSLADLQYELKDNDGALASYRSAVKLDPASRGFYKNYIDIVLQKKNDAESIPVIQTAIKFGEADMTAYAALGDIFRKKGQCGEAIKMYQEVLKLDPKNIDAVTSLGECEAATGDLKNAIISYEQVVLMKQKPSKEYKLLGDLQLKIGKTDNAMEAYQKYLAETPSDQLVARTVGLYQYEKKKFKEAIGYFELVKDAAQQNTEYLVAVGDCYYQTGDTRKTIDALSRAWAAKPAPATLVKVLKTLADCYQKINDNPKALEVYDAYIKLPGVKDQEASYLCGFLREPGDRTGAIKVYAANTTAYPKDYRNFLHLGLLLAADSTASDRAAAALKATSALVDTIPLMWETLAHVYEKLKNDDGELLALQKLLALQPQNLEANKRASVLLLKKKQIAPAITNLEMVLTMSPNDVASMLLLVDGYLETKRPAQALEILAKAKAIDNGNVVIRDKLYSLEKQNNQDQKAEAEIKELIELTKDNKYRTMYARDLVAKQRYDEATKIITDIKTNDPMNIECRMLRGAIQKAQKQYDAAIETYKEISFINDNYVPALYERGDVYLLLSQYDRADQYFSKALKLDPKFALAELGMALMAKAQKNTAGYQEHLGKAKALDPKNPLIMAETAKGGK